MAYAKIGYLLCAKYADTGFPVELNRSDDCCQIGGEGATVAPCRVVRRHWNLEAGDNLTKFVFEVLPTKRRSNISLTGIEMNERVGLEAVGFLSTNHDPTNGRHTLEFLMLPIRGVVKRIEIFFECDIMTENDELQPVRICGLLQFAANSLHKAELMARIEARRDVVENHEAWHALMRAGRRKKDRCGNSIAIAPERRARELTPARP